MRVCVGDDLGVEMYDNSWKVDHKIFSVVGGPQEVKFL